MRQSNCGGFQQIGVLAVPYHMSAQQLLLSSCVAHACLHAVLQLPSSKPKEGGSLILCLHPAYEISGLGEGTTQLAAAMQHLQLVLNPSCQRCKDVC